MRISSIICGYNQARFTHEAIASVLAQTYPPHEVIFVDNGSTDDTAAMVATFSSVRYFRQDNCGPSGARNRGLREATGDFVHFLDADDWIEPGFYASAAATQTAAKAADILVGGERVIGHRGEMIHCKSAPPDLSDAGGYLFSHSPWPIHAALVRRQAALSVQGFEETMWRCEDWDFWLRLAGNGCRFRPLPGVAAVYRQVPGSNSADYFKVLDAIRQTLERNLTRYPAGERYAATASTCLKTMKRALWYDRIRPQLLGLLQERRPARALGIALAAWRADPQSWIQILRLFASSKRLLLAAVFLPGISGPSTVRNAAPSCAPRHVRPPS